MAGFKIEPDKQFLCCKDINVVEVFEIDSIYIAPVQQKNWTLVATVHFGEGQEYEALKLGDREIIIGIDLQRLMQDLLSLGIMVNREGLCFLKTGDNISEVYQVGFFRMFDLFDWSKYHVKSRMNNIWVRNDIVTGRPMFDNTSSTEMLNEKEEELKVIRNQHFEELVELKRKHSAALEEFQQRMEVAMKDPSKFAVAAAPVAAADAGASGGAAAKEEEKKDEPVDESDDDLGFSLFD